MNLDELGKRDLVGVKGGENVVKMNCMRKMYFQLKE